MSLTGPEKKAIREKNPFDTRNIRDEFKGVEHETIQRYMGLMANGLIIVAVNIVNDFNVGSVVRSANAFLCERVILTESRKYDKRSAVGAYHYIQVDYESSTQTVIDRYREKGFRIVAAEYEKGREMHRLNGYAWDKKTVLIMGEEGLGLSSEVLDAVDDIVYIPMLGTVRSLNVASCATTFMYAYSCSISV